MLRVESIEPQFQARLGTQPTDPPSETMNRIEEIWRQEKIQRGGRLFSGQIFSVAEINSDFATGWLADYRWFLAQRREPDVYAQLLVRPLAVTGLLLCDDGAVIGQRAGHVEQDAGLWELVPSGGVDQSAIKKDGTVDLAKALTGELGEEIGIMTSDLLSAPEPFVVAEDAKSHVIDVGMFLRAKLSTKDVVARFKSSASNEYVSLDVVSRNEIFTMADQRLTPVSQAIVEHAKRILG